MIDPVLDRPICAFDIETVPDAEYGRTHMGLQGNDQTVQEAMQAHMLEKTDGRTDFLPVHLHQVVVLSCAWWNPKNQSFKISSIGGETTDEKQILKIFAEDVLSQRPRLVSWNGDRFDAPVLHYRWMKHRINAGQYWQPLNRYEAYTKRYSNEHIDLMDVLGSFRNNVSLDESAQMLGFPGKVVTEGHRVFQHINRGELDVVQGYCEMDALNTLLMFVRWVSTRGELTLEAEDLFMAQIADYLETQPDRPGWLDVARQLRKAD